MRLAALAEKQYGVVSRAQLRELGIGRGSIARRIENGQLHRLHRGVYALGHLSIPIEGWWVAALLASGKGAVLSHRSAAELWGLLDPVDGPVHVSTSSTAGRKRRQGIHLHRGAVFAEGAITRRKRIPVTTPARTIADLRGTVPAARWRRAIRQAEVLGLRTGLERTSEPTRSELEHLFLRLCEQHRLPSPEINARVGPYEVDFLWRAEHLIVETDGYRYHRGSQAFEDDHTRDLDLHALGYKVRRFSYRQVTTQASQVASVVANALRR
ncbi:MAG TPA: type IV toxin-antitoxin system AbiEi family antitoxin domain-containing protein [Solirubrobacterales bacterium]|nr:type IV toxin-antitoxin system AbiEi family antitoxin domain-containing protein [Solirubrobacterales bacterium]